MDSVITQTIEQPSQETVVFPDYSQKDLAKKDLLEGLKKWNIWLMLSYQDIKLRYRRSVLGPFWLTLSMAITVYSMGYLYGHLFHIGLQTYFPYLVAGMITWNLFSAGIAELTDGFTVADGMLKQIKLPHSLHIHRVASRHIIIFFHNILVMAPVLIIFHDSVKINMYCLLMFVGLFAIYVNAIFYGLVFAMIGARFRDLSQIIKSLIQVIFFITPIMWTPEVLPAAKRFIAYVNPFYSFLELVRSPLLGAPPALWNYLYVFAVTIIGYWLCMKMFTKYRSRIVYWL